MGFSTCLTIARIGRYNLFLNLKSSPFSFRPWMNLIHKSNTTNGTADNPTSSPTTGCICSSGIPQWQMQSCSIPAVELIRAYLSVRCGVCPLSLVTSREAMMVSKWRYGEQITIHPLSAFASEQAKARRTSCLYSCSRLSHRYA